MASRASDPQADKTKVTLIGLFLAGFGIFAAQRPFRRHHAQRLGLPLSDLALLVSATHRLGRMVAYDKVFEPIRAPVTETRQDAYGAGQTVVPRGEGTRRAFGELVSCPICAGTWIAAGLVYALHLFPGPARLFMTIMGAMGLVEVLDGVTETLTWTAELARAQTGAVKAGRPGSAAANPPRRASGTDQPRELEPLAPRRWRS